MGLALLVKCLEMKVLDNNYVHVVLRHFLRSLLLLLLRRIKMAAVLSSQLYVTLLEQGGTDVIPRSHSTSAILWFCDHFTVSDGWQRVLLPAWGIN